MGGGAPVRMPGDRPTSGSVTEDIWPSVAPAVPDDETSGWPFATYVAAIASAIQQIDDWVRDSSTGIGWSMFLDPARCPPEALPWLAQFAGVVPTKGATWDQQRVALQRRPGLSRGTRAAMISAVQETLYGSRSVVILERNGGPWKTTVVVRTSECPDTAATLAAAMSQKPAGITLTVAVVTGEIWDEAVAAWNSGGTLTWDQVGNPTML